MHSAFERRNGYSLRHLLAVIWAASSIAQFPDRLLNAEPGEGRDSELRKVWLQILQRGYYLFTGTYDDLIHKIHERLQIFGVSADIDIDAVRMCLDRITLTVEKQRSVSLWTRGPRYIVKTAPKLQMLDLSGIMEFLQTLFVFLSDKRGARGPVFEQAFREALQRRGYEVMFGQLKAMDGSERELDAGVWTMHGKLFIFECVSVERPLDFEIGKPSTVRSRTERISEKLRQAESLREFMELNRKGRNFDLSKAETIEHFVVSPFIEWIWSDEGRFWYSHDLPRILCAGEVIRLLSSEELKNP